MTTPNKLTMLRICLIPVFLFFFFLPGIPHHYLWALLVFVFASITDFIDGRMARKYNLVTDFGKLMDPLADKLLVMAALVAFVAVGTIPGLVGILILGREFLVTSIRQLAASNGRVLAADRWGKYKTASQMVWLCWDMLASWVFNSLMPSNYGGAWPDVFLYGHLILMTLVVVLTVFSGANYMIKNRELFLNSK